MLLEALTCSIGSVRIFIFILHFSLSILQKYMVRKFFLQNYTSSTMGTAAGTYRRAHGVTYPRGTIAPTTTVANLFPKFCNFLFEL
jgi:hypothetical protein